MLEGGSLEAAKENIFAWLDIEPGKMRNFWRFLLLPFIYFPLQSAVLLPLVSGVFRIEMVTSPWTGFSPTVFNLCTMMSFLTWIGTKCRRVLQESRRATWKLLNGLLWSLDHSLETCWLRVTFGAPLRFEHPSLFIDCRQSCMCWVGGLHCRFRGHVLGWVGRWGKCFSAAHVPLNHKTGAGGHLKVSPFKELSPLAVAQRKKGVKLEALSPPSPNNTPDQPVPALPHPPPSLPCTALSQPLSTTTRLSASFLSQVKPPPNPDTHTHPHTIKCITYVPSLFCCCLQVLLVQLLSDLWICMSMHIQVVLVKNEPCGPFQ